MFRRKESCHPQYVFKFHYLMCTCVSTWNMHMEVREQFSGIISLLLSCVSWDQTQVMKLGASTLTHWATLVPCPKSLVLFLRLQSVVEMEHHLCKMQSAHLGAGNQQGFGSLGLALAAFLQELSLCESRKPREMVWLELRAGLDCWIKETYLKVSWPQTSGGQSASVHRACHGTVNKHGGHNLDPKSGLATHSQ